LNLSVSALADSTASPILVVGSVALDSVETPAGRRDELLGGAASHFSIAASLFTEVRLVAVVGDDFPAGNLDVLRGRDIDLGGLEVADGPSFRWRGRYHEDMDHRDTLELELGVFATFRPRLPAGWEKTPVVFLANIDPDLQLHVLDQAEGASLTACDTIEHWIVEKRDKVARVISRVDIAFMNEDEARLYADRPNLLDAASVMLEQGCRAVVIKKGEGGSLVVRRTESGDLDTFLCPSFPVDRVVDPTGAGDAFAGGVMGWLAASGNRDLGGLRRAVVSGTVVASFAVAGFGPEALLPVDAHAVEHRIGDFLAMTRVP
jgi:sugar/nucleoside kinase (ribokinase family)